MSELFDKEVECTKREFEKNFRGSRKAPVKVCDENERNKQRNKKKNDARVKMFLVEGSPL